MKSHEYARKMRTVVEFLLSRPEFDLPQYVESFTDRLDYFGDKDKFIDAVRAVGSGKKEIDSNYSVFLPETASGAVLKIAANREVVCRKIQDEVWECEPLLTPEEEAAIG